MMETKEKRLILEKRYDVSTRGMNFGKGIMFFDDGNEGEKTDTRGNIIPFHN
jgi:hypothetical protein